MLMDLQDAPKLDAGLAALALRAKPRTRGGHGSSTGLERSLPSRGRLTPTRILIVEDNELSLKLLKDILEFQGYTIIFTDLGEIALELVRKHEPDLILLDMQLPDMPGTAVARQLKSDEHTRAIPIIAVTAFAMSGDRERILESGCDDYISKPFNVLDVLALVERYAERAKTKIDQIAMS
jgi:two-component system, cell cycle response regulator DivK